MMRRIRVLALVMAGFMVAASGCKPAEPVPPKPPAEPAMKITAKADPYPIVATNSHIRGRVTPAAATAKVVLQRTVGGKWVDWQSCPATGCVGAPRVVRGNVSPTTGEYVMTYPVQLCGHVLHLRVRSLGGSAVSPGFYVQATRYEC